MRAVKFNFVLWALESWQLSNLTTLYMKYPFAVSATSFAVFSIVVFGVSQVVRD